MAEETVDASTDTSDLILTNEIEIQEDWNDFLEPLVQVGREIINM